MVNEWKRADLPSIGVCQSAGLGYTSNDYAAANLVLDAVVEWLDAHHPKPETDRWRRAHEIVERERDQARDERDKWKEKYLDTDEALHRARASLHEACKVAESYKVHAYQATERAEAAERERDEWKFRTEAVEQERDEWESLYLKATFRGATPIARAVAAEARTAPAVTKRELRSVVGAHDPGDDELAVSRVNALTDRLWSLVSGADPAVFVVRESDLPEAWRDRDGLWRAGQSSYCLVTPEDMRSVIPATLGMVAARESVARAIEAEEAEAVDPVEELAGQIESATREAIRQVCDDLADVVPSLDPLAVERAMEVTSASRKVAAHVLGQEVK